MKQHHLLLLLFVQLVAVSIATNSCSDSHCSTSSSKAWEIYQAMISHYNQTNNGLYESFVQFLSPNFISEHTAGPLKGVYRGFEGQIAIYAKLATICNDIKYYNSRLLFETDSVIWAITQTQMTNKRNEKMIFDFICKCEIDTLTLKIKSIQFNYADEIALNQFIIPHKARLFMEALSTKFFPFENFPSKVEKYISNNFHLHIHTNADLPFAGEWHGRKGLLECMQMIVNLSPIMIHVNRKMTVTDAATDEFVIQVDDQWLWKESASMVETTEIMIGHVNDEDQVDKTEWFFMKGIEHFLEAVSIAKQQALKL